MKGILPEIRRPAVLPIIPQASASADAPAEAGAYG